MRWKLNIESPLVSGMTTASDLLFLNFLWLLTSLPVVTIGASNAALYRVVMDMHQQKGGGLLKRYFRAWKENWKQATVIWLPTAAVIALFFFVFHSFETLNGMLGVPVKLILCFIMLLTVFINGYAYAYLGFFEDTVAVVLKNSLGAAIQKLPVTALIVFINLVPVILLVYSVELFMILLIFWLLIGIALSAYLNAKMILGVFEQVFLKSDA